MWQRSQSLVVVVILLTFLARRSQSVTTTVPPTTTAYQPFTTYTAPPTTAAFQPFTTNRYEPATTAAPYDGRTTLPPITAGAQTTGASTAASYVIMASQAVFPGLPYTVTVTIPLAPYPTGPVSVAASLLDSANNVIASSPSTIVNIGAVGTITLQIPETLSNSGYSLHVVGSGGLTFDKTHEVYFPSKALSIFVQTDKAVYTPKQQVKFRVLIFHPDLTPYSSLADIAIYDCQDNKLIQWLNQSISNGVFSNLMQLSDMPTPGKWKIEVIAQDYTFIKTFEVAQLELSAFEVVADVPSTYYTNLVDVYSQENITFTITAKYTFGSPVNGTADVTLSAEWYEWENFGGYYTTVSPSKTIKYTVVLVDGVANMTIPSTDLHDVIPYYSYYTPSPNEYSIWSTLCWRRIFVAVSVVEASSGKVGSCNSTMQASCYWQKYSLNFINTPNIFRPGFALSGQMQLTQTTGKPLDPTLITGTYITLSAYCYDINWSYISLPNQQLSIPDSGRVSFSINFDGYGCYQYPTLQASFSDILGSGYANAYQSLNVFYTRDNQAIQVVLADTETTITVGSTVTFIVNSTFDISLFSYQLVSRDILIKSELLAVGPSTVHYFNIYMDAALVKQLTPSARIIVWFMTSGGEIVADSLDFSVEGNIVNPVTATFSSASVQPGASVTVTVNAGPSSYVGLMVVDKAAARTVGNDIDSDTVLMEVFSYHNNTRCLGAPDSAPSRRKRDVVTTASSATDTAHVFFAAGVFVITDAFMRNEFSYDSSCPALANPVSSDASNATVDPNIAGFLETWLFEEAVTSATGTATFTVTVPDRVTSWMLTAFTVGSTGLGLLSQPVNLTATKSFFLSCVAPFVVVRGEEFGLTVVANNLVGSVALTTQVTLLASVSYRVRLPSGLSNDAAISTIEVPSYGSAAANFWIVPDILGEILLSVSGVAGTATDTTSFKVIVQPEGIAEEYSMSISGSPSGGTPFTHTFNVTLPAVGNLVPGSQHIIINTIGDFIGQTIDGLGNLLQMPCGCGEQTMIGFAPDVYILKYLRATKKNTAELEQLALSYISSGYQGELTFQHADYSYSAFGIWDWNGGSVWLSAFVVKCFHQAKDFIPVNMINVASTLQWIAAKQKADGSFAETGKVYHVDMQGLASGGRPLTAYVLVSLLENADNPQVAMLIRSTADLTIGYLEGLLTDSTATSDPYLMNIMCYALTLAGSTQAGPCLTKLELLSTSTADGMKFWQKEGYVCESPNWWDCWWFLPPLAIDVEMTAYALLTYTYRGDVLTCDKIAKWLMAQRNGNGGFISTQDTVVALQALSEYAELLATSGGQNAIVKVTAGTFIHTFDTITSTNSLILQRVEVPANSIAVDCEISGIGVALIQMTVKYYVYNLNGGIKRRRKRGIEGSSSPYIQVHADQEQISDTEIMLTACASWSGTGESGMVMMEIGLPTGYSAKDPTQMRGQGEGRVKNVEVSANGKELNVYLDELVSTDTCVNVTLTKVLSVTNVQKARVTVYLYYNPSERTAYEYESLAEGNATSYCDQCPSCCACSPPDYFQCDGNCFAAAAKCNGTSECSDNSDEANCPTTVTLKPTTKAATQSNHGRKRRRRRRKNSKKMIRMKIKRSQEKKRQRNRRH